MENKAGIYIHIPFCIRKCPYCDFYSITDRSLCEPFLKALIHEMEQTRFEKTRSSFDTLYLGGGTPSALSTEDIARIIGTASHSFSLPEDTEITIEVNPGTVNFEKLRGYRQAKVNRINIGVQSFQDETLRFLGRIHSSQDACLAIQQAKQAGFKNIGLDLIYGIPGQSLDLWRKDLQQAVDIHPSHLSCYMLTYEQGTRMDRDRQKGRINPLSDLELGEFFELTVEFLKAHGYIQYEISNFSRSISERSRHNQKYWSDMPYLGFGPSAHSFIDPVRYWNHRSIKKYIQEITAQRSPIAEKEVLTPGQRIIEVIYLGLRRREGINLDDFYQNFNIDFNERFKETISSLAEEELITLTPKNCVLTRKGRRFLDSVAAMFLTSP